MLALTCTDPGTHAKGNRTAARLGSVRVAPRARIVLSPGATRPLDLALCATGPERTWPCVPLGQNAPRPRTPPARTHLPLCATRPKLTWPWVRQGQHQPALSAGRPERVGLAHGKDATVRAGIRTDPCTCPGEADGPSAFVRVVPKARTCLSVWHTRPLDATLCAPGPERSWPWVPQGLNEPHLGGRKARKRRGIALLGQANPALGHKARSA